MRTITTKKAYCTTAFGDVHYWHAGTGPVLLMLHQASQSSAEFAAIAPMLADHFTILALDYPGHGQSDDPDRELLVPDFSAAVVAVLDELAIDRAHVCGHHSGGFLAIDLAVNHKDRIEKVIMSGIGIRTEENVRAVLERPMTRNLPIDTDGEFLARSWDVYRQLSSPGVPAETTFNWFIVGLEARRRPFDAHFAVLRWDRDPVLQQLRKRTLLICGEFDPFAEAPERLLDVIPDSRLVHIAGGGAFLFYEKPAECAQEILEFLEEPSA